MYLLVRHELNASAEELLIATGNATLNCLVAFENSPAWKDNFQAWRTSSYGKIALRVKEKDIKNFSSFDRAAGFRKPKTEPLVFALPPREFEQRERELAKLQAFTLARELAGDLPVPDRPFIQVVFNPAILMSLGKMMAQIGHGVQLLYDKNNRRDISGLPIYLRLADLAAWNRMEARSNRVEVVDSGFTEVAPGSVTLQAALVS